MTSFFKKAPDHAAPHLDTLVSPLRQRFVLRPRVGHPSRANRCAQFSAFLLSMLQGSFRNGPPRLVNAFAEGRPLRILPPMNAQVGD